MRVKLLIIAYILSALLLTGCNGQIMVCSEYAIVIDDDGVPWLYGKDCYFPLPEGEVL